jgi:putative oxygen-independent coproporphyrinogen III oxidase
MQSIIAPEPSLPSPTGSNWRQAGFGVYVHWPFCQAKCPYCDFNSHVAASVDQAPWRGALVSEIGRAAERTSGRGVVSIFLGGGTPSLMEPRTVAAVLDAIAREWQIAPDVEVTLEANPTSVEAERFSGYRSAGVNRLSLGVQALNDGDLRRLGRRHSADEARSALAVARETFPRVSADIIYARQNQDLATWRSELDEVLSFELEHLSLYQLTVEDGTVFGARHRKGLLRGLPTEDHAADLYMATQEACEAVGMPGYEVSNHAMEGGAARHNLVYWRAGDWVGIGPGAFGRVSAAGRRWESTTEGMPAAWLRSASSSAGATRWEEVGEHGLEYLMMGLRLREGVSLSRLGDLGLELSAAKLRPLIEDRFVSLGGDRLRITARGRPLLNAILRALT